MDSVFHHGTENKALLCVSRSQASTDLSMLTAAGAAVGTLHTGTRHYTTPHLFASVPLLLCCPAARRQIQ
jgi:hypothetical protein